MKFYALNSNNTGDSYIEIEINLIPGLPRFSIIGLPDASLKEGVLRIKSALLTHGFDWPRNQEVIVNLKPNNNKKWNQNVELAITLCFLYMTKQIVTRSSFDEDDSLLVLGDLDLMGRTTLSKELARRTFAKWKGAILTGDILEPVMFDHYSIKDIGQMKTKNLIFKPKTPLNKYIERPKIDEHFLWSEKEARLISILSLGAYNALLAGAQGSGKTTLIKEVWKLLKAPNALEFEQIQIQSARPMSWRPLVTPHHSIPKISLVGGGVPPRPGEVSRAHCGVMILDEFLEFKKESIEVLREAMQSESIEISRLGHSEKFNSKFQALATTNLCPCGKWSGIQGDYVSCARTLSVCKSYINRMVGPVLDRFQILWLKPYTKSKSAQTISTSQILKNLDQIRHFRDKQKWGARCGPDVPLELIYKTLEYAWLRDVYSFQGGSERRRLAFWQVARTLADLDQSTLIREKHIKESYEWTCKGFGSLA